METKIKKFVDYVNNTPTLKMLKVNVYKDINLTGWFGTDAYYSRFINLFEVTRRFYIEENKMRGAGDIIGLSTLEIKTFCQSFVDEYEQVKNHLNNLVD